MGAEHFMGRRDILVNTLLGLLLVFVFALPFFLALVVLSFVLEAAGLLIARFWPQWAHSQEAVFLGLIALAELTSAIGHWRKRQWRNAFLSFAAVPMILSIWLAAAHSSLGLNGPYWIAILFLIFSIPLESVATRVNFFVAASGICAVIAVNTGMLGSGLIARIVSDCVLAGVFLWFANAVRHNRYGLKNPGPQTPPSPAGA
jgi:hypothetical protein